MFTPIETTLGAILLQQVTSALLFNNGSILGASGLLRGFLTAPSAKNITFLAGMALSFTPLKMLLPGLLPTYSVVKISWPFALWAVATGLLTGWGTKNCCGCTSGHMLCGLSRLSARSLVAVATFFPTALITHHLLHPSLSTVACPADMPCYIPTYPTLDSTALLAEVTASAVLALRLVPALVSYLTENKDIPRLITQTLAGFTFGLGLLISGMASPSKVLSFFSISFRPFSLDKWDPSLSLIILFAILPNIISWNLLTSPPQSSDSHSLDSHPGKPKYADQYELPTKRLRGVNARFLLGAAAFGVAWGASGVCPGPAVLRALWQPAWGVLWMSGFWTGALLNL